MKGILAQICLLWQLHAHPVLAVGHACAYHSKREILCRCLTDDVIFAAFVVVYFDSLALLARQIDSQKRMAVLSRDEHAAVERAVFENAHQKKGAPVTVA